MSPDTATSETQRASLALADHMARLMQFQGPPGEFLAAMLDVQCEVAPAQGGAILSIDEEGRVRIIVVHPPPGPDDPAPLWLAESVQRAPQIVDDGKPALMPLRSAESVNNPGNGEHLSLIPLRGGGGSRAVAAYRLGGDLVPDLDRARERLELTIHLLSLYEMRLSTHARHADLERLRGAMAVLDATNEQQRLKSVAIAFCNELAARFGADRVALGFLKGRYVKTAAISHTEKYDRKMKLVQAIESAMEECLDQDVEIIHPPAPEATYVCRAAGDLALRYGPTTVISLPLRREGEPVAVVTLERSADRPLSFEEVEALRLTADLCSARLADLHATDKWIGAKLADATREGFSRVVGPRHTWSKVIAVAVIAAILFLALARGPDRVDASFEITAVQRRMIPAPFAGRLQTVGVEPGDLARAGQTVLATLETVPLQLRLAAAKAERAASLKEADLAMREGQTVEVQIAEANLRKVNAEIRLLEHQITEATILAPIDGTVVIGDLKQRIGAPVETGDLLFEIAPLGALRAELEVPEDRIVDLAVEDDDTGPRRGTLASVSHPGDYIPFEVEHVNPVAEVVDQKNVFRVRVRLLESRPWLRPGMKGVAKVNVGRRPYAYLWTRKLVNWIRMKLWI